VTINTAQFRLGLSAELGVPISRDTVWNLCRRYEKLRKQLIRPQREGSLWHSDAIEVGAYLWRKMRPWGQYRRVRPVVEKPKRAKRPTAEELDRLRANIEAIVNRRMGASRDAERTG